jgi:prephenate dehydrogenase
MVVGAGLIGTSIALALTEKGARIHLSDIDRAAVEVAVRRGAGEADEPPGKVDLVIVAVPPSKTGAVIAEMQRRDAAHFYTDVASVKSSIAEDVVRRGGSAVSYVGGHPMAGGERSGPLAADPGLFHGRRWAVCPQSAADPAAVAAVRTAATMCGATPVLMAASAHDRIVARVSHVPHLAASLVAARLSDADRGTLALAGKGIQDVTRIAAGDPALWLDIVAANAAGVAEVLDELAADLVALSAGVRDLTSADAVERRVGASAVADVLRRGKKGRDRMAAGSTAARIQSN